MPFGEDPGAVATQQPLRVNFHVPESVFVVPGAEERKIVVWDAATSAWITDGVNQDGIDLSSEDINRVLDPRNHVDGLLRALDVARITARLHPSLELSDYLVDQLGLAA